MEAHKNLNFDQENYFIGYSHSRFRQLFTRLTMEPFVCTELEVNRDVSGGASHKFNAIRHGQETAEIGLSPETSEIVCNALTSAQHMR